MYGNVSHNGGQGDGSVVKVFAMGSDDLSLLMGPTAWKDRSGSSKLSSDLHIYAVSMCAQHTDKIIYSR